MVTLIMFILAGLLAWNGLDNPEESTIMFVLAACCAVVGLIYHPFKDEAQPVERKKK